MSDLIIKGAGEIKDGLYNIKDGKLFQYKADGGTVRTYPIISAEQEPKQGEWVECESYAEDKEDGFETTIVCSCCDFPATIFNFEDGESRTQVRTDFCPNCGARMESEEE